MKLKDIVNMALTYTYIDKRTGIEHVVKPEYKLEGNNLRILTPVIAYKIIVLRRLLYIAKLKYNIIVGYPDDNL